jgi:hypothetical protein
MKMVDGYRCYSLMSSLERNRWNKAVTKSITKIPNSFLLNEKYWTFEDFIGNSFIWSETKEGDDYWLWVSKKYVVHDLLWIQPRWKNKFFKNEL